MRIAFFTETFLPKIDGVVTRVIRTLDQLHDLGHDAIIFAPEYRHGDNVSDYRGFPVVRLKSIPFKPWYPELRLGMPSTKIYSELKAFDADLVHTVNPFVIGAWGTVVAANMDIPMVASYHTDLGQYAERLKVHFLIPPGRLHVRTVHNAAQLNLTTSVPMVKVAEEMGIKRIRVWPKAVATESFHPGNRNDDIRHFLSQGEPEKPLIICVGRLSHEKRVSWLLEAAKLIPGIRIAIIGGGPAEEELKELFRGTPTFFAGYMKGERLAQAYASADVFAFPSDTETLGFVAMESMASGVPVVGARAGGIPDVINHGVNSLMFDSNDRRDFVTQLRKLLDDEKLRSHLAKRARIDMEACSWRAATESLVDYYHTSVRAHRRWKLLDAVA
ncbi:MAG: glycosyltransferase [Verrucomicrobiota bacterium]